MSRRNKKEQRGPLTPQKKHLPDDDIAGLGAMKMEQFSGYTEEITDPVKAVRGDTEPVCMATQVRQSDLPRLDGMNATAGQWIVSTGGHDSPGGPESFGPFQTMEEAFEYGRQTFKVVSWRLS